MKRYTVPVEFEVFADSPDEAVQKVEPYISSLRLNGVDIGAARLMEESTEKREDGDPATPV